MGMSFTVWNRPLWWSISSMTASSGSITGAAPLKLATLLGIVIMFLLWMKDGGHLNAAPAGLALRCRPWCHRTKAATAEVIHSLQDLLLAIHDEGTVSHNRLINGFTTDQQDHGVVIGFHAALAACPIQHNQLPFTCH